jgi:hypothetical protein
MSCPECGTVIERLYSTLSTGTTKDENCPNCDEWLPFKQVMEVPSDSSTAPDSS